MRCPTCSPSIVAQYDTINTCKHSLERRFNFMLKSQEITLKMSELRERANKLSNIEPNLKQHDEIRAEIAALEAKVSRGLESETSRD